MKKGFTLIELLVVIAIIGVMMAAVIVSINPTKRLQDARDSNKKQVVATVASAAEACIVKNVAVNTTCDSVAELVTDGYLKQDPTGAYTTFSMAAVGTDGVNIAYTLENGGTGCGFWRYTSATGRAACSAT